eukprot:scaffold25237_cov16-Tisochrysis_lutea.AAC.1
MLLAPTSSRVAASASVRPATPITSRTDLSGRRRHVFVRAEDPSSAPQPKQPSTIFYGGAVYTEEQVRCAGWLCISKVASVFVSTGVQACLQFVWARQKESRFLISQATRARVALRNCGSTLEAHLAQTSSLSRSLPVESNQFSSPNIIMCCTCPCAPVVHLECKTWLNQTKVGNFLLTNSFPTAVERGCGQE